MPRKEDTVLDDLWNNVSSIFDQAQSSLANHRKNCVALCKLHHQAGKVKQKVKNGDAVKLVGEKAFGDAFIDMVNRVLVVKKGPPTADRIVKFIGSYVKFLNDKVTSDRQKEGKADNDEEEETLATRFASRLLKWLIQGFAAKDKTVRYRAVFVVSEMISHLGEIDEDMYEMLREGVLDRMNDKEPLVRIHAAIALSKLVGSEDPDEIQEGEATILEVLLDVLEYDPAAEVRRAALLNAPLTQASLPVLLSRTRDTEAVTRKLVYSNVLKNKLQHPRQLSLIQREQIVKDGLGDREPGVRLAAGKMIASWFDAVVVDESREEEMLWEGDEGGVMKGFIHFLALFDVVGPGQIIAVDAILSIFVTRPGLLDSFVFPDSYWRALTPESAVLARTFIEHCFSTKSEANVEYAALPVVTAFAFHIQGAYNTFLTVMEEAEAARLESGDIDDDDVDAKEEDLAKQEVVLGELLRMTLQLDYMDEIGRRKISMVVRDMIAHPALPPGLIERCLDVLREITPSERELIRLVVEVVIELRDNDEEEDPLPEDTNDAITADTTRTTIRRERSLSRVKDRQQMSAEESMQADMTDMRCLLLCIGVLERVNGNFEDNSTLEGVLADLIIPSVRRKELPMREKGLVSLGLCCLIAKNMAFSSFQLFVNQVEGNPPELQLQVLKVILDLLITYEHDFFGRSDETAQQITVFLLRMLEVTESDSVRATVCVGLSKLLLSGVLTDERILISLLALYVSPETVDNQELRQCLSYFFPVYFYSSPTNQNRLVGIFSKAMKAIASLHEDLDDDQKMISPYQFGQLLVDWANPQKVASSSTQEPPSDAHIELAIDIIAALYDSDKNEDEMKILCQLLGQLVLQPGRDRRSLMKLDILLLHHDEQCPFNNVTLDKMFTRFQERFRKTYANDLGNLDRRKLIDEDVEQLYEFIGVEMPEELLHQTNGEASVDSDHAHPAHQEEPDEEGSPPRRSSTPQKRAAQEASPPPSSPSQSQSQSEEETKDEDEAPPDKPKLLAQSNGTPRKRKGVKRVASPGSTSPKDTRKRGRVVKKSQATASSDSSRATTPTKSRNGKVKESLVQPTSESDESEADSEVPSGDDAEI